jgi:hypothetical protein
MKPAAPAHCERAGFRKYNGQEKRETRTEMGDLILTRDDEPWMLDPFALGSSYFEELPSKMILDGNYAACKSMCAPTVGACDVECRRAVTRNSYERGLPLYVPFEQSWDGAKPFPNKDIAACSLPAEQVDAFKPNQDVKTIFERSIDLNT